MREFLPTVDILADFQTDKERALWLLQASDGMIARDYSAIRSVLVSAGFRLGVDCLDIRSSSLNAVRDDSGELPAHLSGLLRYCRLTLRSVAGGGGG